MRWDGADGFALSPSLLEDVLNVAKTKNPLTDADLKALNTLIQECTATAEMCAKCERCNLDVAPESEKNAGQLDTARKIKAEFFPHSK